MFGGVQQSVGDFPRWEPHHPGTVLQTDSPSPYAAAEAARYETGDSEL